MLKKTARLFVRIILLTKAFWVGLAAMRTPVVGSLVYLYDDMPKPVKYRLEDNYSKGKATVYCIESYATNTIKLTKVVYSRSPFEYLYRFIFGFRVYILAQFEKDVEKWTKRLWLNY